MTHFPMFSLEDEALADRVTCFGAYPLAFTGLLAEPDVPVPSIVSARILQGRKLVLLHTLCEQEEHRNHLLRFLQPRGISWSSLRSMWTWAIEYSWPFADDIAPEARVWRSGLLKGPDAPPPGHTDALHLAMTEHGRHAQECCFAIDQLVVAWDPDSDRFRFPVLHDLTILAACLQWLEQDGRAFRLTGSSLGRTPQLPCHTFRDVGRFAESRGWPRLGQCLARLGMWEEGRVELRWAAS